MSIYEQANEEYYIRVSKTHISGVDREENNKCSFPLPFKHAKGSINNDTY